MIVKKVICVLFSPQKGTKAPQAAGRIHTDFEKGFIMAEVMKFDDFKSEGSESAVKVFFNNIILIIEFHSHFNPLLKIFFKKKNIFHF